jgi:hypothetical protein
VPYNLATSSSDAAHRTYNRRRQHRLGVGEPTPILELLGNVENACSSVWQLRHLCCPIYPICPSWSMPEGAKNRCHSARPPIYDAELSRDCRRPLSCIACKGDNHFCESSGPSSWTASFLLSCLQLAGSDCGKCHHVSLVRVDGCPEWIY